MPPFRLQWPTHQRVVTQHFLENPLLYARFDLPGHEGIDLRAGRGAEVYAAADGVVYEVATEDDKHPYGRRVRIRHEHEDGIFKTTYAHLLNARVSVGQRVRVGDLIGHADNTGNSFGNHLHLSLKKEGATARGETTYITFDGRRATMPDDLVDPALYLDPPPARILNRPAHDTLPPPTPVEAKAEAFVPVGVRPEPVVSPPPVVISPPPPPSPTPTPEIPILRPTFELRGLHGDAAADWMRNSGLRGWATEVVYSMGDLARLRPVDYSSHEAAGVRVIVRWNYSYAKADGGLGTYPTRDRYQEFIDWCAKSITMSRGVWGHIVGNEPNRAGERPDMSQPITPDDIAAIHNGVWNRLPKAVRLSPPAIDPTNIETADPRQYWRDILSRLQGAEFFALHGYSYGSDQPLEFEGKFNPPLEYQVYGFRMWEMFANVIFDEFPRFLRLPLIITETNPLYLRGTQTPGWDADADRWIGKLYNYITNWNRGPGDQFVHGVCLYRFTGDAWRIDDKPHLLSALRQHGAVPI